MDVVLDLTARAVVFVTLAQDIAYKLQPQPNKGGRDPVVLLQDPAALLMQLGDGKQAGPFQERINEVMGQLSVPPPAVEAVFTDWVTKLKALLSWLDENRATLNPRLCYYQLPPEQTSQPATAPPQAKTRIDPYPAPQQWRLAIRHVLYTDPPQRVALATALDYLPVLVDLAHRGGQGLFNAQKAPTENWQANPDLLTLLKDDELLFKGLVDHQIPLPFEIIYRQELKEIQTSRQARKQLPISPASNDPIEQAEKMNLRALAFSGGGIRSATFNLGVLQGLAKAGLLPGFDIISTVSGGGYIGAWYTAWIKRDGLLLKVQDRLDSEKSTDPRGEEVRPIRWLRMFSNYLTPNNNIMSTDSWTLGITWIRNTLLNQVIILLLLCSVLLVGLCGYIFWRSDRLNQYISSERAFTSFSLLLLVGALLAGLGMGSYRPDLFPTKFSGVPRSIIITAGLVLIGSITAYLVSSWLFVNATSAPIPYSFSERFTSLWDLVWVGTFGLLLVAFFGRYDKGLPGNSWWEKAGPLVLGIVFSGLSAGFGILLLDLAWGFLQTLALAAEYVKLVDGVL